MGKTLAFPSTTRFRDYVQVMPTGLFESQISEAWLFSKLFGFYHFEIYLLFG